MFSCTVHLLHTQLFSPLRSLHVFYFHKLPLYYMVYVDNCMGYSVSAHFFFFTAHFQDTSSLITKLMFYSQSCPSE